MRRLGHQQAGIERLTGVLDGNRAPTPIVSHLDRNLRLLTGRGAHLWDIARFRCTDEVGLEDTRPWCGGRPLGAGLQQQCRYRDYRCMSHRQ
jgi:hypothetical protein